MVSAVVHPTAIYYLQPRSCAWSGSHSTLHFPLESHMALGSGKPFVFTNTLRGASCTIYLQYRCLHITLKSWENKLSHFLSLFQQWSVLVRGGEESKFWWFWFSLTAWLHGSGPSEMPLPASLVRRLLINPSQGLCGSEYHCFPEGHLHAASFQHKLHLVTKHYPFFSHLLF